MGYIDRIRGGFIAPWVGEGVAGAVRTANVARAELATLGPDDRLRAMRQAEVDAWTHIADRWAQEQEHETDDDEEPFP